MQRSKRTLAMAFTVLSISPAGYRGEVIWTCHRGETREGKSALK